MNHNQTNITSRISKNQPATPRKEEIDALAHAARQRLSSQPAEVGPRKGPEAILDLPPEMNPAVRFINHRDARPDSLMNFHRKIRRTRYFLMRAGFPAEFADTPVESFPWHIVDVSIARSFAQLLDAYYPNTKSRHNILGILRELLRQCAMVDLISATERDHLLDCLPVRGAYHRGKGRELTDKEIVNLLAKGLHPNERLDLRNRAIIAIFLSTGLRISEVAELEFCDLDLNADARSAHIKRTKPGRTLTVWLTVSAIEILKEWLAVRGEHAGALFDSRHHPGRPLCTAAIRTMLTRRAALAHINSDFTSHDFRRTFATRALRQNADVFVVQRLLGHKNVQTTLIYDRRTELEDRAVVDTLNLPGLSVRIEEGKR